MDEVVVLGAGVGGLEVAGRLAVGARRGEYGLLLVDEEEAFAWEQILPVPEAEAVTRRVGRPSVSAWCAARGVRFLRDVVVAAGWRQHELRTVQDRRLPWSQLVFARGEVPCAEELAALVAGPADATSGQPAIRAPRAPACPLPPEVARVPDIDATLCLRADSDAWAVGGPTTDPRTTAAMGRCVARNVRRALARRVARPWRPPAAPAAEPPGWWVTAWVARTFGLAAARVVAMELASRPHERGGPAGPGPREEAGTRRVRVTAGTDG
ncbi:MAG: hypothetical protein RLZZ299_2185 [Pseudomonadota bacterium]|jgi:hypothetical protein